MEFVEALNWLLILGLPFMSVYSEEFIKLSVLMSLPIKW